jgi:hypothetical protein
VLLAALLAVFELERSAEAAGSKYCINDMSDNCLRTGINSANNDGVDTIWLGNGQINLRSALPTVTTTGGLWIVGRGAGQTTISGSCKRRNDANGECISGAAGIFTVAKGGALFIASITVTNGDNAVYNEGDFESYSSTIERNHNIDYHTGGGGIYNSGSVYLDGSTVNYNFSDYAGGGGIFNWGLVEIVDSTIHSNKAIASRPADSDSLGGGGIANQGTLAMANSTIYGNVDEGGGFPHAGGIVNDGTGAVWLGSVTITNNYANATASAGGVFSAEDSSGFYLFNTIIARNGPSHIGPDCGGNVFSLGGNLVGTRNYYGTTKCGVTERKDLEPAGVPKPGDVTMPDGTYNDPGLEERFGRPLLKDNGGNSCTVAIKNQQSRALNKGWKGAPGSHPLACAEYDQRGVSRNRSGWTCDIGAYEFRGTPTPSGLFCPD